jgi:hypothetical protein
MGLRANRLFDIEVRLRLGIDHPSVVDVEVRKPRIVRPGKPAHRHRERVSPHACEGSSVMPPRRVWQRVGYWRPSRSAVEWNAAFIGHPSPTVSVTATPNAACPEPCPNSAEVTPANLTQLDRKPC